MTSRVERFAADWDEEVAAGWVARIFARRLCALRAESLHLMQGGGPLMSGHGNAFDHSVR